MLLTDNLIAYYKLDSAGITTDASGGGNTLTNNNSTPTTTGRINEAADFNGTTNNRSLSATLSALDSAAAASYSFWFNRASTGNTIAIGTRGSDSFCFAPLVWTDGQIYCDMGVLIYGNCTHGVSTGSWGHVVVVFDGAGVGNSDRLKIYVNGSAATMSYLGTIPATLSSNANQGDFFIGRQKATRYSTGQIDEVGVWSRALSAAEAAELFGSGSPPAYPFSGGATPRLLQSTLAYYKRNN